MPMVYSQDYLDKLQANKKDDKENDIVPDIRDTLMSYTSYIYEESLNNLMEKVHNQNDFTLAKDNNKFLNIDYTTIPSSVLGQLGRVNEIVSFQIVDEAATGLYIIAELDGTFKDIQGNKSVLAENVANIGAHYYNKENNAENLKDIVTVIPMENTEFDQTFINDVNHAYAWLEFFDVADAEGLYWDEMTEEQHEKWENFVIATDILNKYDYNEIWEPVSDLTSEMIFAIYFP